MKGSVMVEELHEVLDRIKFQAEALKATTENNDESAKQLEEISKNLLSFVEDYKKDLLEPLNHLDKHVDKLGSTSNIVIMAIKEIMDDVNRLSSESKQASLGSIQMLRKYMKDELPTIVNGIDTKPLSKKIEDEIIRTITLDTDKINCAAQTQSKIIDDLMKATPSIISSVTKIKHSVESIEEYQNKDRNKLLWITGGLALAIGLLLGIILTKSIG